MQNPTSRTGSMYAVICPCKERIHSSNKLHCRCPQGRRGRAPRRLLLRTLRLRLPFLFHRCLTCPRLLELDCRCAQRRRERCFWRLLLDALKGLQLCLYFLPQRGLAFPHLLGQHSMRGLQLASQPSAVWNLPSTASLVRPRSH